MTATSNLNKFEGHEKSIDHMKSELELVFRTMSEITAVSATKVKVSKIENRLNEFASIEHVKTLKEFLLPKIQDFSNKVDDFQAENLNVRECVIHMDQSLSLKSNKNDFTILSQNLRKEFLPIKYMSVIDEKIKEMQITFKNDSIDRTVKFDEYLKDQKQEFD
jgi:hypothetical protein